MVSGDPLSIAKIRDRFSKAQAYSEGFHNAIERRRRLYDGQHYNYKPRSGEHQYVDPSYGNVVDIATSMIMANDVEFSVKSWSPGGDSTENCSKIEKILSGIIAANEERLEESIKYTTGFQFSRDGCTVLYTVWDDATAHMSKSQFSVFDKDGNPDVREGYMEVPVVVNVIDPMEMYFVPGRVGRWAEVFHVEKRTLFEIETEYEVSYEKYAHLTDLQKMDTDMEVVDYWRKIRIEETDTKTYDDGSTDEERAIRDVVQHAIFSEDKFLLEFEDCDDYSDIPYNIQFFKPVDANSPDSSKWFQSIIDPMIGPITYMERLTNRRLRQIDIYMSLPLVIRSIRNLNLDPALEHAAMRVNPDEDVSFPMWNGNPPDVEKQLQFFDRHSQESSFPSSMFGEGPSSVSGYALSQMTDQGRIRLEQPVEHLELLWRVWAKRTLAMLAKKVSGKVLRVYGKMKGADFNDQIFIEDFANYQIDCKITPEFPNDEVRKHSMAMQAAPFMSTETVLQRYFGIEQPDDELTLKMQETITANPQIQQYIVMNELLSRARAGDPAAATMYELFARMTAGAQGSAATAATPISGPGQRNPSQALGGPSPTNMPTPQENGQSPAGQDSQFEQAMKSIVGG